jgi:hypothetical protein
MHYSLEHMETACCIWEAMLEMRNSKPDLDQAFLKNGASEMRLRAISLAAECCDQYNALSCDDKNEMVFDWEFVPAFVASVNFSENDAFTRFLHAAD